MLTIERVEAGYGENIVLRSVSMHIRPGQVTCLMGRNGVGKTTLIKTVIGLLPIKSGNLTFLGKSIKHMSPDKRAKLGIGYVPQGRDIFPQLTVEDNLLLGLEAVSGRLARTISDDVFDLFPVLRTMLRRKGGDLSGGQQQQLAIARALISRPKLLLLDEPMEGIQPSIVQEIEGIIERLKASRSIAIVLVEQSLPFAAGIADYVYVMDRGVVAAEGRQDSLSQDTIIKHLVV